MSPAAARRKISRKYQTDRLCLLKDRTRTLHCAVGTEPAAGRCRLCWWRFCRAVAAAATPMPLRRRRAEIPVVHVGPIIKRESTIYRLGSGRLIGGLRRPLVRRVFRRLNEAAGNAIVVLAVVESFAQKPRPLRLNEL